MPVDLGHGRHGRHGDLGQAKVWDCPACGVRNEGRGIAQGCGHCGAGDPTKNPATQSPSAPPARPADTTYDDLRAAVLHDARMAKYALTKEPDVRTQPRPAPTRVLRLIEYLATPGQEAGLEETLRRSLIGTLSLAWGTMTASIVDSVDTNQEDRLQLAKRQPGVWLGNPILGAPPKFPAKTQPMESPLVTLSPSEVAAITRHFEQKKEPAMSELPELPVKTLLLIAQIAALDLRVAYTLALGLQTMAEAGKDAMEAHKLLRPEECLAWTEALLAAIPEEWDGETKEEALNDKN